MSPCVPLPQCSATPTTTTPVHLFQSLDTSTLHHRCLPNTSPIKMRAAPNAPRHPLPTVRAPGHSLLIVHRRTKTYLPMFHAGITTMQPHNAHPPPSPHPCHYRTLNHAACPRSPFTHLPPTCLFDHLACLYKDIPPDVHRINGEADAPGEPSNTAYIKARTQMQSSAWPG